MQFVIFGITSQEILKIKQNRSSGDWKSCKNIENLNLAKMRCRNKERNFATDTNKVNILKNVSEKKSDRKHNFWKGAFFDFHHHIPWFFFKIAMWDDLKFHVSATWKIWKSKSLQNRYHNQRAQFLPRTPTKWTY